jgi:hypothetical protein
VRELAVHTDTFNSRTGWCAHRLPQLAARAIPHADRCTMQVSLDGAAGVLLMLVAVGVVGYYDFWAVLLVRRRRPRACGAGVVWPIAHVMIMAQRAGLCVE